ncbi:MAG TPA: diguanylate cyclase [Polyangiaceae bacterium]|nr:diguanylate cyclase [Polyangiaceae bacterium]
MSTTYVPASTLAVAHSMVVPKAHRARRTTIVAERKAAEPQAEPEPTCDVLYGLVLARTFDDRLEEAFANAESAGAVVSLVLIRVGFDRGLLTPAERAVEAATRAMVADELRRACREGDVIGRHDDADLGVILPGRTESEAKSFAERARRIVRRAWLESEPTLFGRRPSLSIGTASGQAGDKTPFELELEAAEALLAEQRQATNIIRGRVAA